MQIKVRENTLGDLANDLTNIATTTKPKLARVVRKNINEGTKIAKGFARAKAGPHGKNYYKRLSAEMTGPLEGEYGPEGDPKTDFVGVGFRHGVNLDLPNSADLIAEKFIKDVGDVVDGQFW